VPEYTFIKKFPYVKVASESFEKAGLRWICGETSDSWRDDLSDDTGWVGRGQKDEGGGTAVLALPYILAKDRGTGLVGFFLGHQGGV
jgi:hypothetical protein